MPNFTFTYQYSVGDIVYILSNEKISPYGETYFVSKGTVVSCKTDINNKTTTETYDITLANGGYTTKYVNDLYDSVENALAALRVIIENT